MSASGLVLLAMFHNVSNTICKIPHFACARPNQHNWWGFAGTGEAAINGFGVRVHGVGGRSRLTFSFTHRGRMRLRCKPGYSPLKISQAVSSRLFAVVAPVRTSVFVYLDCFLVLESQL